MKKSLIIATILLSSSAFSGEILKHVSGNFTCKIFRQFNDSYVVKTEKKIGDIKINKTKTVKATNLDKTILRAYEESSNKDGAVKKFDTLYAGYKTMTGDQGSHRVEFDLDPNDSTHAMKLVFSINHMCKR